MRFVRIEQTPFPFRANIVGSVSFTCPYCGHDTRFRLLPGRWRMYCRNKRCNRVLTLGIHACSPVQGPLSAKEGRMPADWLLKRDRQSDLVHFILPPEDDGEPTENE